MLKRVCNGVRKDYRNIVVSIPVVLNIDVETELLPKGATWNFPATFCPDNTLDDVVYELAALGLFSKTDKHFNARYLSDNQQDVYTYDGAKRTGNIAGIPTLEKDATSDTHFFGSNVNVPSEYRVTYAMYRLRGGMEAQDRFLQHRITQIASVYSLRFPNPSLSCNMEIVLDDEGLKHLPSWKRHWLIDPDSRKTSEYIGVNSAISLSPGPPTAMASLPDLSDNDSKFRDSVSSAGESSVMVLDRPGTPSVALLNCRCGTKMQKEGVNVVDFGTDLGEVVECNLCSEWSHIACQKNGRADRLGNNPFHWDSHSTRPFHLGNVQPNRSRRILGTYFKKTLLSIRLW